MIKNKQHKKKKSKAYLIFIGPGFLLYTFLIVFPIFFVLYLSIFEWSGLGKMVFVGWQNFKTLFQGDVAPIFGNAMKNNIKYLLCVWFIITPLQFLLAYVFYLKIPLYKYYKFMIFMPYVISQTIISFFATMIFNPNIGFLNTILEKVGLVGWTGAWLGNPDQSFTIMLILIIWQGAGTGMMIFYANLMDIPAEIIEAASLDGCNQFQKLVHVILPFSLPAAASIIIMSSIWALSIFDMPFILGGPNGGVKSSLDFVNLVFYRYTFGNALNGKSNLGFGAAISVLMFIIILIITFIQNKFLDKLDYNKRK